MNLKHNAQTIQKPIFQEIPPLQIFSKSVLNKLLDQKSTIDSATFAILKKKADSGWGVKNCRLSSLVTVPDFLPKTPC